MEGSPFAGMSNNTPSESYSIPVRRSYRIEVSSNEGLNWDGAPSKEYKDKDSALDALERYHPPSSMDVIYRVVSMDVCEVGRKVRDAEDMSKFQSNLAGKLPCDPLDRVEVICNENQRHRGKAEEFNWRLNSPFKIYSWRYLE